MSSNGNGKNDNWDIKAKVKEERIFAGNKGRKGIESLTTKSLI
jgi:hypothetical protein